MRIREILITENYSLAQKEFSQDQVPAEVDQLINTFKQLVQKNQITGAEKDINYWRNKGFEEFKKFVLQKKDMPTARAIKQSRNSGRNITLFDNDNWLVVIPLDHEASCHYGRNTDWCTTKQYDDKFAEYFYDEKSVLVYIINHQTQQKWAFVYNPGSFHEAIFDQQDNEITDAMLQDQTGGEWSMDRIEKLVAPHRSAIARARTATAKTDITVQLDRSLNSGIPNPALEQNILAKRHAVAASSYAASIKKEPWPEAEPFIVRNGFAATQYARYILQKPWPEAEPAIARDGQAAALYVATVTNRPWPEAEPEILKKPMDISIYLFGIGWPRWPEAEPIILKEPFLAADYAIKALKKPWPEAEKIIKKNPYAWKKYREGLQELGLIK